MWSNNHRGPSLVRMLRHTLTTGLGALHNRGELFVVELQEEGDRLLNVIIFAVAGLFFGMLTVLMLTATLIFVTPAKYRLLVAIGFMILYLAGAIWGFLSSKALLKQSPFQETTAQFKKDRELLESLQ